MAARRRLTAISAFMSFFVQLKERKKKARSQSVTELTARSPFFGTLAKSSLLPVASSVPKPTSQMYFCLMKSKEEQSEETTIRRDDDMVIACDCREKWPMAAAERR